MTKSEIQAAIKNNQDRIDAENGRISELEEQISKYEAAYSKLEKGDANLADFCSTHKDKIKKEKDSFSRVKIIDKYISAVVNVLEGQDYTNTKNDFDMAKARLTAKKGTASSEIERLRSVISTQNSSISSLRTQYSAMLLQEKQDAKKYL